MDPAFKHQPRHVYTRKPHHGATQQHKHKASKEQGAPINIRPFWICPRGLLVHNMVIASQIQLVDPTPLQTNMLANAGLLLMLSQTRFKNFNGALIYMGAQLGLWGLWAYGPHSLQKFLTAPELRDAMLF